MDDADPTLRDLPQSPETLRLLSDAAPGVEATQPFSRIPAAAPEKEAPKWITDGTHHVVDEIKLYLSTVVVFARSPRRAADRWTRGELRAINPLNYILKSFAVVTPWRALWWGKFGLPAPTLAKSIILQASPYFYIAVAGAIVHWLFRLLGSRRPLRATWGAWMYLAGGVPAVLKLFNEPVETWHQHLEAAGKVTTASHLLYAGTGCAVLASYVGYLVVGLAGVHRTSIRRAAVLSFAAMSGATIVALVGVVTGLLVQRLLHP
jgi:hypothetical protein